MKVYPKDDALYNALQARDATCDALVARQAQHEAGYRSPAAFREAFERIMDLPPSAFQHNALLRADWIKTPLGAMIAVSSRSALHLLEFTERKALPTELQALYKDAKGSFGFGRFAPTDMIEHEMNAYMEGRSSSFETPLSPHGTPFMQEVWRALRSIPAGHLMSYSQLAREMGRPQTTRAVARANGANPIAVVIPCHRLLGADGNLTGYGGGLWRKKKLIELEQSYR